MVCNGLDMILSQISMFQPVTGLDILWWLFISHSVMCMLLLLILSYDVGLLGLHTHPCITDYFP